jgi:hypothetical protein
VTQKLFTSVPSLFSSSSRIDAKGDIEYLEALLDSSRATNYELDKGKLKFGNR